MKRLSVGRRILLGALAAVAALVVLFSTLGWSVLVSRPRTHLEVPPADFGKTNTPEELREDLRAMLRVYEEVHPDLFARAPRADVERRIESLERSLDRPLTRVEFFPTAARLAATFRDAHTTVSGPYEEWNRFLQEGGRLLPFSAEFREGEIVVRAALPSAAPLRAGDRIESINGRRMDRLVADFAETRAGSPAMQAASLASNLDGQLWYRGVRAPFVVAYRGREPGRAGEATLAGRTMFESAAASAPTSSPAAAPQRSDFSFRWLPNDVALIDFRSMSDGPSFDRFLASTFESMRGRARGLIVDLRGNGGGDSSLGNALLGYLTDKPFRMASRKEWRSSARYREYLKNHLAAWLRWAPLQYLHPFGREFWSVEEGAVVVTEYEISAPPANDLRFRGPACFLIGPCTFSSAMMLANAVKDFELATLIGDETGECPTDFGEIYGFDLPHSRLQATVSSARFVRASGDAADPRGVVPDLQVEPDAAASAAGRDPGLERARRWIDESTRR